MKIYITGCAKSGTTLLQRLFYAFEDVEVIDGEIRLEDFIERRHERRCLVGKRHCKTVFSNDIPLREATRQIDLIREHHIQVLNIVRDGRDVIESDNGYVPCERWIESIRHMEFFASTLMTNVHYEQLVKYPEANQGRIAECFHLAIKHPFSEYPSFVPEAAFEIGGRENAYNRRQIETERIMKNPDLYRERCQKDLLGIFVAALFRIGRPIGNFEKQIIGVV